MRSRTLPAPIVGLATLLLPALAWSAPPILSGDVEVDFVDPDGSLFPDPNGVDVGVPVPPFPAGTISGNDMADTRLYYDFASDTLYVGINTYVIAGDVDGDGDPGRTGGILGGLGGTDIPDFGGTEAFTIYIDVDQDGVIDVLAGVPFGGSTVNYTVSTAGPLALFTPSLSFQVPLPFNTGFLYASPSAAAPDLEFTISNFSSLPSSGIDVSGHISIGTFIGSLSDAGIGEDYFPGVGTTADVPLENCGDGFVDGLEECDDGNFIDTDA